MRSRNGNRNFSLSIPLIILFCSLVLNAGEYLISYRYLVKNYILYNETLDVSKAMKPCKGEMLAPISFEINSQDTIKSILSKNRDAFIDYLHTIGLSIVHHDTTLNAQYNSTTLLTLKTRCFKVDFNDNFVKISPFK